MARRIFGIIVFLWCGVGVIGAGSELLQYDGVRFGTVLGSMIFCGCLSLIGLSMALSKPKPTIAPDDKQPPASE